MDFEKLRKFRNESNAFANKLGIVVEEIRPGYARSVKTVQADETNPAKVTHGGVCYTLADVTAGAASSAHGYGSATVTASYNYLRSCHAGDTLTAEAKETKAGKTICVYDVQVSDQNGRLVGSGTFTFYIHENKLEF